MAIIYENPPTELIYQPQRGRRPVMTTFMTELANTPGRWAVYPTKVVNKNIFTLRSLVKRYCITNKINVNFAVTCDEYGKYKLYVKVLRK